MKTFLKVLVIAAVLVIAIKLSPLLFLGAIVGLIAAAVLGSIGLSLVAAFIAVALALVVALAPIWLPVLCVIGLVKLFRTKEPNVVTA
jgi:hypothetical protein